MTSRAPAATGARSNLASRKVMQKVAFGLIWAAGSFSVIILLIVGQ
jgi:hypothetical protein